MKLETNDGLLIFALLALAYSLIFLGQCVKDAEPIYFNLNQTIMPSEYQL